MSPQQLPPLPYPKLDSVPAFTEPGYTADQMREYARAALAANVPADPRKLIEQCRDALAEELGAWDIDPPLFHVKEAHEACVAWLAAAPAPEADELEKVHEARRQAQTEAAELKGDILKVASAVSNAGLTLVRTANGYEVRKFGKIEAQAAPAPEAVLPNGLTEAETSASPSVTGLTAPAQAQQPIGQLFQHGETGRTRVVLCGDVADCDARWLKVGDLVLVGIGASGEASNG
jgi:hypothetical protein